MKRAKLLEGNKLQEIPDMAEPHGHRDSYIKMQAYQTELDARRTFDAPDFKGIVGEVYFENVDYRVEWTCNKYCETHCGYPLSCTARFLAIPIQYKNPLAEMKQQIADANFTENDFPIASDESQDARKFTLEEMIDAWETGEMFGERVERDGMNSQQVRSCRNEFFQNKFNISIHRKGG